MISISIASFLGGVKVRKILTIGMLEHPQNIKGPLSTEKYPAWTTRFISITSSRILGSTQRTPAIFRDAKHANCYQFALHTLYIYKTIVLLIQSQCANCYKFWWLFCIKIKKDRYLSIYFPKMKQKSKCGPKPCVSKQDSWEYTEIYNLVETKTYFLPSCFFCQNVLVSPKMLLTITQRRDQFGGESNDLLYFFFSNKYWHLTARQFT